MKTKKSDYVAIRALFSAIACVLFSPDVSSAIQLNDSSCPHIRVLEKSNSDEVSFTYDDDIENPSERQIEQLEVAVGYFTPLLCQAVRRIVFARRPNSPGTGGWSMSNDRQDLVYLNVLNSNAWNHANLGASAASRASAVQVLVHESAHAAVRLLQSKQKSSSAGALQERPNADLWSGTATSLAGDIIKNSRLDKGVIREWARLHESFQNAGIAGEYYGGDWTEMSGAAFNHVNNGFASAYGGAAPIEDIAEYTGWALTRDLFTGPAQANSNDEACTTLSGHGIREVPGRFAAVYAKLSFLRGMGFIDTESFNRCVGMVGFGIDGPGFHREGGGQEGRNYNSKLAGSLGLDSYTGNYVFTVEAEGSVTFGDDSATGVFSLKLSVADGSDDLDLASWPRGLFPLTAGEVLMSKSGWSLSDVNYYTVPGANQFWLKVKDKPAGTIVSVQGLALVVDGEDGALEGSIVLQKTLRPFAPMPVPQVVPGRLKFLLPSSRN
jgi:hypothetical protein